MYVYPIVSWFKPIPVTACNHQPWLGPCPNSCLFVGEVTGFDLSISIWGRGILLSENMGPLYGNADFIPKMVLRNASAAVV